MITPFALTSQYLQVIAYDSLRKNIGLAWYDSYATGGRTYTDALQGLLCEAYENKRAQGKGSFDCGVFVAAYVDYHTSRLGDKDMELLRQEDMPLYRVALATAFVRGVMDHPYPVYFRR
ncbi:hypothetical protein AAVH_32481 [Aphelenchoides avenae]|nr:hypothetical protein AAVH_32481 [Aphelenchus avenae]